MGRVHRPKGRDLQYVPPMGHRRKCKRQFIIYQNERYHNHTPGLWPERQKFSDLFQFLMEIQPPPTALWSHKPSDSIASLSISSISIASLPEILVRVKYCRFCWDLLLVLLFSFLCVRGNLGMKLQLSSRLVLFDLHKTLSLVSEHRERISGPRCHIKHGDLHRSLLWIKQI